MERQLLGCNYIHFGFEDVCTLLATSGSLGLNLKKNKIERWKVSTVPRERGCHWLCSLLLPVFAAPHTQCSKGLDFLLPPLGAIRAGSEQGSTAEGFHSALTIFHLATFLIPFP